jgi:serine/threonine-protein kinase
VDPERWQKIRKLFQQASELAEDARERYLREACAEDQPLADEVRRLLAAADQPEDGIRDIVSGAAARATVGELPRDELIGHYRIVEVIGEGGMGRVYLAERADDHYRQKVAIKIVGRHAATSRIIERFRAERQILANLDHPHIARLLDGGETEDGLPYLVMEYVEGRSIIDYCRDRSASLEERLDLFVRVCDAVDHAHRNLVIHRDIKPANIWVTEEGVPKLLDFGIAKLLDPETAGQGPALTRADLRLLTPEYASPEQVTGAPITTATDVYSLGLLLYELLTDRFPYGSREELASGWRHLICETNPPPPSTVVGRPQQASQDGAVPSAGSADLRQRRAALRGDLDKIVMTAIRKEPDRRYAGARALADDIRACMDHRPVAARADTPGYRLAKFMRRHRTGVAATAAVLAFTIGLVAFYTERLAGERDRATLAARQASEVSAFLSSVFESASPLVQQGESVSAVNLLEHGAARIVQLADQPALQAELYRIMGASFTQLGKYARGRELLEESLALREADPAVEPSALAETLEDLGEAQRYLSELELAIASLRRALAIRQAVRGPEHADVARTMSLLGRALGTANRNDEALETLRSALAMKRRLGDEPDIVTSDILGNIATRLDTLGRYAEAAEIGRQAIEMSERINGPMHPHTIIRMSNQALVLARLYDLEAAAAQSIETIDRARRIWPPTHPRLSFALQSYAALLQTLGRFDQAWPLLEEAAEGTRAGSGEESLDYVGRLYGIASWHLDRDNSAEAISVLVPARDTALRLQDDSGYFVLITSLALGGAYLRAGDLRHAAECLEKVVAHQDRIGRNLINRANVWLALVYSREGRGEDGLGLVRETLADIADDSEASQLATLTFAAEYFRLEGNLDEALALGERAERIARERFPPGNWVGARARAEYARTLLAAGRDGAARPLLEGAAADLRAVFGSDDARVKSLTALL